MIDRRPPDRTRRRWPIAATLLVVGGTLTWWLASPPLTRPRADPAESSVPPVTQPHAPDAAALGPPAVAVEAPHDLVATEWRAWIAAATVAASAGTAEIRTFVYRLFQLLDQLAPTDRRALLQEFFASGLDARFGSAFALGPGGVLQAWPTLRVALLDYLSQRDATAARELARHLLTSRPEEPAEWTLALRTLTVGQSPATWPPELATALHRFVADPAWRIEPTHAWLEGFDLIVASGRMDFLPDLAALAADPAADRAAQFAAFLAADRLALQDPLPVLARLNQEAALFAEAPTVRAGLFARADVRVPDQRAVLEAYLRRRDVTAAERTAFGELFPLYDLAVSHNLVTSPRRRTTADMQQHDRAALALLASWSTEEDLAGPWRAAFTTIAQRLRAQLDPSS